MSRSIGGRPGGCPAAGGGATPQTLPSSRASGPSGPQALQRIDGERQRLEVDVDELDRLGRDVLAHRGQRQDRLALIERLVGERALGAAEIGEIVGGDEAVHARQRQGPRGVDAAAPARAASG